MRKKQTSIVKLHVWVIAFTFLLLHSLNATAEPFDPYFDDDPFFVNIISSLEFVNTDALEPMKLKFLIDEGYPENYPIYRGSREFAITTDFDLMLSCELINTGLGELEGDYSCVVSEDDDWPYMNAPGGDFVIDVFLKNVNILELEFSNFRYYAGDLVISAEVVPLPSAVILGSIGLTFSGWLLRRRKML